MGEIAERLGSRYGTWILWAGGGLILLVSIFLWSRQVSIQTRNLYQALNQELTEIRTGIEKSMKSRIRELESIAERFAGNPKAQTKQEWEKEAGQFLKKFPEMRGISYADADLKIRWGLPEDIHKQILNSALDWDLRRKSTVKKAIHARGAVITPTMRLRNGQRGFGIFVPIFEGDNFKGFISSGAVYEVILRSLILQTLDPGFFISVQGDAGDLFTNDVVPDPEHSELGQVGGIQFLDTRWSMWIQPSAEKYAQFCSLNPYWALSVGAFLSTLCFAWGFTLRQKKQNIEAMSV